jgi:hypothetical protein
LEQAEKEVYTKEALNKKWRMGNTENYSIFSSSVIR